MADNATTVAADAAGGTAGAAATGATGATGAGATPTDDAAKAAAAAAATQTPEQKAATEKAAADKAVADKAAADKADADRVTAIKSTLKLPADSGLDPAVVESTTAIASASKLSPDHAQKVLDHVASVAKAHGEKAVALALQSMQPGGTAWEAQNTKWKADALADPDLGNGKPEQLAASATLGQRVLATFFPKETIEFLEKSGLGSHPATLKGLVKIGKMMKEDDFVTPSSTPPITSGDPAATLWPKLAGAGAP